MVVGYSSAGRLQLHSIGTSGKFLRLELPRLEDLYRLQEPPHPWSWRGSGASKFPLTVGKEYRCDCPGKVELPKWAYFSGCISRNHPIPSPNLAPRATCQMWLQYTPIWLRSVYTCILVCMYVTANGAVPPPRSRSIYGFTLLKYINLR